MNRTPFCRLPARWQVRAALVAVVLAVLVPAACDRSARVTVPSGSNVLLITVDTLRGDALGWIGGRNETPALDRLAAEGVRFRQAVSPAPLTLPATLRCQVTSHLSVVDRLTAVWAFHGASLA